MLKGLQPQKEDQALIEIGKDHAEVLHLVFEGVAADLLNAGTYSLNAKNPVLLPNSL